jgi:hypothetical protein
MRLAMRRLISVGALLCSALLAGHAFADTTTYEFTAKNDSSGPMTVLVDGKVGCSVQAGKSCRLSFTREDATLSYALAGGAPAAFSAGNIEATDLCNFDAAGAHCVDSAGNRTN